MNIEDRVRIGGKRYLTETKQSISWFSVVLVGLL